MDMLYMAPMFEGYLEKLGFTVSDLKEPRVGNSGGSETVVHRFRVNGFRSTVTEKSTPYFDRVTYCGPIPLKPKWVRSLNRLGLGIDEGPKLTFFSRTMRAYKPSGSEEWIREDPYIEIPFP